MKEALDINSRKELIKYRIARAVESLSDADFCASGGRYTLAVNRLYYACFYIASALLNSYSLECATHKGIKTMLICISCLPVSSIKSLARLFRYCSRAGKVGIMKISFFMMKKTMQNYARLLPTLLMV